MLTPQAFNEQLRQAYPKMSPCPACQMQVLASLPWTMFHGEGGINHWVHVAEIAKDAGRSVWTLKAACGREFKEYV